VGWLTRVYSLGGCSHGLGPRYCRLSTTCARALGCPGFFARTGNFESPHHFRMVVDRFQIALRRQCFQLRAISIFFMATSESCRLSCSLVCHRPPFLAATSGTPRDIALGGSGGKWCTTAGMFSHFLFLFFANFLICSQATTLLADGHSHLLP